MGAFQSIVNTMMQMDVFHLFFPWLLVLALTYGALNKANFFEDNSVNGVVAVAIAFMAIGGISLFVPQGLFTNFAAVLAFSLFAILGFIILLAVAGVDIDSYASEFDGNLAAVGALVFIVVGIIGTILTHVDIQLTAPSGGFFDQVVMPVLILVFLFLIVAVTAGE